MKENRNPLIYRLLFYAIFAGDALFSPFYALYFVSAGMNEWQQSVLLASVPFALFLGDFIFSFFATSFKKDLRLFRAAAVIEIILFIIFGFARTFPFLLVMTVVTSFFNSALFQVMDGTAAIAAKASGKRYQSIRVYGSIAYAGSLFLGFFIVGKIDYSWLFDIASLFFSIGLAISFLITPVDETIPPHEIDENGNHVELPLIKNKRFILYLLFYALFFGASNTLGSMLTLYLKGMGLADNEYSFWYGARVVFEIISMILLPYMMKLLKKDKNGLIVGSVLYLFSNVLSIFITDKIGLVASVFLIRGFANAFAIVRNVTYVQHLVGDKKVARALTLCAGFANAVNGIGNLLSSTIYQAWSFQGLFFIMLVIQIGGFVILLTIKDLKPNVVTAPSPGTISK